MDSGRHHTHRFVMVAADHESILASQVQTLKIAELFGTQTKSGQSLNRPLCFVSGLLN